jgi:two-component system cell cycle sensor histidine kinase/response regulator CckA
MEHNPIYVFFKDENIRSIHLSRNYEQLLGMPINEILDKTMDEIFPSDLAKSMIADDKHVLEEGKMITVVEEFNGRFYETIKFPIMFDGKKGPRRNSKAISYF